MKKKIIMFTGNNIIKLGISTYLSNYDISKMINISDTHKLLKILSTNIYTHLFLDSDFETNILKNTLKHVKLNNLPIKILNYTSLYSYNFNSLLERNPNLLCLTNKTKFTEANQILLDFLDIESINYFNKEDNNPFNTLTKKQFQLAKLFILGKSNKNIAIELNLKPNTISTVKKRIYLKLKVDSIPELVRLSILHKIKF